MNLAVAHPRALFAKGGDFSSERTFRYLTGSNSAVK
jgi:hypothetical protein